MSVSVRRPTAVAPGDPITASNTDAYRQALQPAQLAAIGNVLKVARPRPWQESQLHRVDAVFDDYLTCVRVYSRKRGEVTFGTEQVRIARPVRLRASELSRDGVSYTYVSPQERTATKGPDTETQKVTPSYLIGEYIEARPLRGLSGVDAVDNQRRALVDGNVDGRAWAAEPEP